MTVILRDPGYRQRLARCRRKTKQAEARKRAERERYSREFEAYLTTPTRLIKKAQ